MAVEQEKGMLTERGGNTCYDTKQRELLGKKTVPLTK